VATRVLLALTAVLVLAWTGVLLRNLELAEDAALRGFFGPKLSEGERERDLESLEDAQLLDPSSYWELAAANYHLVNGDPRRAVPAAEALVRAEPENIFAWRVLLEALRQTDRPGVDRAAAEIRRLNPLGSG
jgi:hypothetical protein